jgi:esterase
MRLNYECYGEGPPLIILHGLFGSLDNWRTLSRKFGRYYRVFAVDLRNHGSSPHSDDFSYPLMAQDLNSFMDGLSLSSACLLGHSMGGKVAMEFAVSNPNRVEKLVVVDIAPKEYMPQHDKILQELASLDLKKFTARMEIDIALRKAIPDHSVRQFLLKNLVRNDAGVFAWRINLEGIARNYGEIIKSLHQNNCFGKPALFLKGENSNYIQQEDLPLITRFFPQARLVTVPNAGHWVQADAPAQFLTIVLSFLKSR